MNGKFHQYSFATLESFGNTDVFVKPFFEFSVASGKLTASVKVYPDFSRFRFYLCKIFGRYGQKDSRISILVVFYLRFFNGVSLY